MHLVDKLESVGINVPQSEKYFPNFIVWDMEAMLQKIQSTSDSQDKKLQWLTKHVPISISIASNVSGYEEPKCIVDLTLLLPCLSTSSRHQSVLQGTMSVD